MPILTSVMSCLFSPARHIAVPANIQILRGMEPTLASQGGEMCLRYLNNGARCEVRPTWTWTNFAFLERQTQLPSFTFPHHPIRNLNLLDSTQLLPSQNQTTRRSTCQIARTAAFLLLAKVYRISSFPQRLELKIALAASRPFHCKLKQGKLSQRIHGTSFQQFQKPHCSFCHNIRTMISGHR